MRVNTLLPKKKVEHQGILQIVHNIDEDFDTLDNIDEVDSTTVKPDFRISGS